MRRLLLGLTLLLGVTTLVHAALLTDRWMLVGQGVTATYQAPVTFDVPSAPQTMNWLMATTPKRFTFAGRLTITARVDATSGAWFNYQTEPFNTCVSPATARPYFEVANPGGRHLKRGESTDNFRWWSADVAILLTDGTATVTVPLVPDAWSNVNGQRGSLNPAGFSWALGQVGALGLTFGGGCFFGHGVQVVDGSAQFALLDYSVSP